MSSSTHSPFFTGTPFCTASIAAFDLALAWSNHAKPALACLSQAAQTKKRWGQTFRAGDNFFRSSPTCSFSEEAVVHACGLSLKTPVQTCCSASGFIFVMQNCMHISQTLATKTRLRVTQNATVLQFKWMHVHVQGTARAAGSFQWRFFFFSPHDLVDSY